MTEHLSAAGPDPSADVPSPELVELATAHGVATDFWDWRGQHVVVPRESVEAVLAALGVPAHTEESVRASLAEVAGRPVAAHPAALRRPALGAAGHGPGARPARRAGAAARRAGGRRPGRPGAGRPLGRAAHHR